MGLDIGTRRIGVALSDELGIIASPTDTIHIPKDMQSDTQLIASTITTTLQKHAVRRIVVGLPRNMKGERGVQAEWTIRVADALREALREAHIPVSLYDERLTSVAAERADATGRQTRARRTREQSGRTSIDARAAALILQGYLDRERSRRRERLDDAEDDA
jgi:putative Holliday junction resolvase